MKWSWDKFGIDVGAPQPERVLLDQMPRVILRCLKLDDIPGVRVEFYDSIAKAAVIVQAKVANPTWQQISDASRQSGWSVEVFAAVQFDRLRRLALYDFNELDSVCPELAQVLVDHGYFTLRDLAEIDLDVLMRLGMLDSANAEAIIREAAMQAEQMEI